MNKKRVITGVVAGMLACAQAWALNVPGRTPRKVNDYAQVIDAKAERKIEALLDRLESTKKVELIVSTFPSLEGMPFDRFVASYARKWRRLWPFENDRRIHFVVIVGDAKMRLGVGRPLQRDLTADESAALLGEKVAPYFEKKQYADGIAIGVVGAVSELGGIE